MASGWQGAPFSRLLTTVAALAALTVGTPALAVYPQRLVLTGDGANEIPSTSISFQLADGSSVPVREDDDGDGLILVFPRDSAEPGTLVITLPGGGTRSIPVRAARPGHILVVDVPRGTAISRPDPPDALTPSGQPALTFSLRGGYYDLNLPPVGVGTLISGGTEDFAALLGDSVAMPFGGLGVAVATGPGVITLYGDYGEGSDSAANATPSGGGVNVGIVFTDFAPSGSTGLFLGNAGLDTMIARDAQVVRFGGAYTVPLRTVGPNAHLFGRIGAEYQRVEQDVAATLSSPTFGSAISARYDQRVDDRYLALVVGGGYRESQPGGLFFVIGADGLLVNRDADLVSRQTIVCTLCAAPDRNFILTVEDSDNGITFGARARAEVGLNLGENTTIGIGGFVEYVDALSQIVNPRTGDDLFVRNQPTALRTHSATNYGGLVTLRVGL